MLTGDVRQAVMLIKSIIDAIQDAKEIPAGTLYAGLMEKGCTLEQYQQIEQVILNTGLVSKNNNLLKWVA
jgi:hypothetical protein